MNKIQKTTLHPVGDNKTDLYPTTSSDQVVDLEEYLNKKWVEDVPFEVGTVNTVPADQPANVTVEEKDGKIVLNFDIPKGVDGQDGQDGVTPVLYRHHIKAMYNSGAFVKTILYIDIINDSPMAYQEMVEISSYFNGLTNVQVTGMNIETSGTTTENRAVFAVDFMGSNIAITLYEQYGTGLTTASIPLMSGGWTVTDGVKKIS